MNMKAVRRVFVSALLIEAVGCMVAFAAGMRIALMKQKGFCTAWMGRHDRDRDRQVTARVGGVARAPDAAVTEPKATGRAADFTF